MFLFVFVFMCGFCVRVSPSIFVCVFVCVPIFLSVPLFMCVSLYVRVCVFLWLWMWLLLFIGCVFIFELFSYRCALCTFFGSFFCVSVCVGGWELALVRV